MLNLQGWSRSVWYSTSRNDLVGIIHWISLYIMLYVFLSLYMINIFYVSVKNKKPTVVQYIFIPYNFWLLRSKSMILYYNLIPVWYQPAGILKPITLSVPIHCQPARTEHFPVATWAVHTTEMRNRTFPVSQMDSRRAVRYLHHSKFVHGAAGP